MNKTPKYGLQKPEGNEYYDVGVHNANMDVIEGALGGQVQTVNGKEGPEVLLTAEGVGAASAFGLGHYAGDIDLLTEKRESMLVINGQGTLPIATGKWFTLSVEPGGTGSAIQTAAVDDFTSGKPAQFYMRHCAGENQWSPWSRLAAAETPQMFDLTLANGILPYYDTAYKFWRTQENIVYTLLTFQTSKIIRVGDPIAYYPVGYRSISRVDSFLQIFMGTTQAIYTVAGNETLILGGGQIPNGAICVAIFPPFQAAL